MIVNIKFIILAKQEYEALINAGGVIKAASLTEKNPLIDKINIISQAVKTEGIDNLIKVNSELSLDYLEEGLLANTPTIGRILVEEYPKVLVLNNEDNIKYNFNYWENYFEVENSKTLRNIFNYVFVPLIDEDKREVKKILYFTDIEFTNRRKMIADMSNEEYQEYLESTDERPELEEVKRLEYLNHQKSALEPRTSERTVLTDDLAIDKILDAPLKYSELMNQIDKQIINIVENRALTSGEEIYRLIDKDVQLKLEKLKAQRLLENSNNTSNKIDYKTQNLDLENEIKRIKN